MLLKKKAQSIQTTIVDPALPLEQRRLLLVHLCSDTSPECVAILDALLEKATAASGEELLTKKTKELADLIAEMKSGPLRHGTFIKLLHSDSAVPRAHVVLQDGTIASVAVPDEELAVSLCRGDHVWLEAQGKAILYRAEHSITTGEEARLERRIDRERVQVVLHDHDKHVFLTSEALAGKLDRGEVKIGNPVLVCSRKQLAFDAIPAAEGLSHYRYLVNEDVPDVLVSRDIGAPPEFIEELAEHVRMEMKTPQLGRRYHLRRSVMKLLTGVSGSGKTLSIQGFWRRLYEVMSETTGAPIAQLPRRVLRLRMSQVLSKWLGESDKQLDRFFDEVDQLSDERFVAPDGTTHDLPVLVICEEADGLARSRGEEAVYDRIQTTLLQRLDTTCQKLKDKLAILLFTTNVPHLVDPAVLRRAGGTTERFGRLNKRAFTAVLTKHLSGLPFAGKEADLAQAQRRVVADIAAWLYSPNGTDKGQVEITYVGAANSAIKHRRDFLTGALVDRAVQESAAQACRAERQGTTADPGMSASLLIAAFDRQIRGIVDQLHKDNAHNYLTLPDGVRVGNVRRLEQPTILPFELERAS